MIKLEEYCPFLIFQCGSSEAATRKLENIKRLYIPWEDVEGIRSKGSVLLSPPVWRLRTGQKEETRSGESLVTWVASRQRLWVL